MLINKVKPNPLIKTDCYNRNRNVNDMYGLKTTIPQHADIISFTSEKHIDIKCHSNLQKLLQYKLPCPCCGVMMLDRRDLNKIKKDKNLNKSGFKALNSLSEYEKHMHPMEKGLYKKLYKAAKQDKNKNLHGLLFNMKFDAYKRYDQKNKDVVQELVKIVSKHEDTSLNDMKKYLEFTMALLENKVPDACFRQGTFIDELREHVVKLKDDKLKNAIMNTAKKLPHSAFDEDAFIVTYSKKKSFDIAIRLLESPLGSVEHIIPKSYGEKLCKNLDIPQNWILECARDNFKKSDGALVQQIKDNPKMPDNMQKHFDKLIYVAKVEKALDPQYIIDLAATMQKESEGLIKLDISELLK